MARVIGVAARLAVLTAALVVLGAAPALGAFQPFSLSAGLDGDPDRESVRTERAPGAGFPDGTNVVIADACPEGEVRRRIGGPQESLGRLLTAFADTRPGREVLVDLRSGASGRAGEARVVSWRPSAGPTCRTARSLFSYSSARPTRRPRGAHGVSNFDLRLVQDRRFAGTEVLLDESWIRPREGQCCPSISKRSYYRYDVRRDVYVPYRVAVIYRRPTA